MTGQERQAACLPLLDSTGYDSKHKASSLSSIYHRHGSWTLRPALHLGVRPLPRARLVALLAPRSRHLQASSVCLQAELSGCKWWVGTSIVATTLAPC